MKSSFASLCIALSTFIGCYVTTCTSHPVQLNSHAAIVDPVTGIGNVPSSNAPTTSHSSRAGAYLARLYRAHDNSTGDLNGNGVPNFEIDIRTPSLDELIRYGSEAEDDTMDYILQENARISTGMDAALIEGDVFLGFEDTARVMTNPTNSPTDNIRNRGRRWRNGVVPYLIDWTFDSGSRSRIHSAMQRFHESTCIQFIARTDEHDYIHFVPRQGCWSAVGRQGGRQEISVGGSCNYHRGTIMHEIMHALGFHHEQTRPDRDDYVIIYWGNIQEGKSNNFDTYPQTYLDNFYTHYDYYSIMHYPMYAFSRNGQPTVVPRLLGVTIGNRNDLSITDLVRIRHYYDCGPVSIITQGANNPETPNDCMDHDLRNCPDWAHRGECQMNPIWMNVNCRKSCQKCNTTTDPITGISPDTCTDNNNRCYEWATRGECDNSPAWMRHNCKLSCNQCSSPGTPGNFSSASCQDNNIYCDYWAQNGECLRNPAYMRMQCRRSCHICGNATMTATVAADDSTSNNLCFNHSLYCDAWAQRGECQKNRNYMLAFCRKSCRVC